MTEQVALWGLGAVIIVLLGGLVLVSLQRRLGERAVRGGGEAPTGPKTFAARMKARRAAVSPKKRVGLAVVAALFTASGGLVSVFAKDHDQGRPPMESQISAGALQGTMLSAGKHTPVILIVPGSGPTDRNGDSPLGIKAAPYRLLAEALARDGISTVRVDKRGMFASAAAGNPNAVSVDIYAADYRAWIDAIREQTGAKCIWLLGHSEGALMVSAAAEGRKDVCGLVLASGAGRPILDVMRDQLQANPANAPILPEALHAIDELKAGRHVDTTGMNPAIARLFAPQVQDFMMSAYGADPVAVLKRAHVRTLILQGSTDLQTSLEDARLLDAAPKTRLVILEGVNHVLKEAPADRAANLATYANPDLPLAPRVAKAIAHFVKDGDD